MCFIYAIIYIERTAKIQIISRGIMIFVLFFFSAITAAFTAHMKHQKNQHIVTDDLPDCFSFTLVVVV